MHLSYRHAEQIHQQNRQALIVNNKGCTFSKLRTHKLLKAPLPCLSEKVLLTCLYDAINRHLVFQNRRRHPSETLIVAESIGNDLLPCLVGISAESYLAPYSGNKRNMRQTVCIPSSLHFLNTDVLRRGTA